MLKRASALLCLGRLSSSSASGDLQLVYSQVVHRHGDRTPITPLGDLSYWRSLLPAPSALAALEGPWSVVVRDESIKKHPGGSFGGVFGMLSQKGVEQLRAVGRRLRLDYVGSGKLLGAGSPRTRIAVTTTDYERTILSVRACLSELLRLDEEEEAAGAPAVVLDARGWESYVPDPVPRAFPEQAALEAEIAKGLPSRDDALRQRVSAAVLPLLDASPAAQAVQFGLGGHDEQGLISWTKLAEISRCLADNHRLPAGVSEQDVDAVGDAAAATWRHMLADRRLPKYAADVVVSRFLDEAKAAAKHFADEGASPTTALRILSAHDATLIMLLAAFNLTAPTNWPHYATLLRIELYVDTQDPTQAFLRFQLNDELLRVRLSQDCASTDQADPEDFPEFAPLEAVCAMWGPRLTPVLAQPIAQ